MNRAFVIPGAFGYLTTGQQVVVVFMFGAGFVCLGYMVSAAWHVMRSNAKLRTGLTREDLVDLDDGARLELVDEAYLSDAGRLARQRAWRCVNRGTVAGAVMAAIYAVAQLAGFGLPR